MITVFPGLKKVYVADLLFPENAIAFVSKIRGRLADELGIDASAVDFEATNEPDVTVPQSDVVITVTPSREPVIKKEWVRPGMHFSTVGSDMEGKEELDPEIFANAKVFVDDMEHCLEAGEVEIPVKKGIIAADDIHEIGTLIAGGGSRMPAAEPRLSQGELQHHRVVIGMHKPQIHCFQLIDLNVV